MKYPSTWSAHLPQNSEEKKNFEELIGINNKVLDRLHEICYNMYIGTENSDIKFDTPNWAYLQANLIGQRKVLKNIMSLCKPVDQRK